MAVARLFGSPAPREFEKYRKGACTPHACDDPQHKIRWFPPRIMRHTAASWFVQDGVPLYDVQALLGHEDYSTPERYAHLTPGAHGKVLESWARRRDASVTHEQRRSPLMTRNEPLTWVGVAGFEPAASSSRSQVREPLGWATPWLTWA